MTAFLRLQFKQRTPIFSATPEVLPRKKIIKPMVLQGHRGTRVRCLFVHRVTTIEPHEAHQFPQNSV